MKTPLLCLPWGLASLPGHGLYFCSFQLVSPSLFTWSFLRGMYPSMDHSHLVCISSLLLSWGQRPGGAPHHAPPPPGYQHRSQNEAVPLGGLQWEQGLPSTDNARPTGLGLEGCSVLAKV